MSTPERSNPFFFALEVIPRKTLRTSADIAFEKHKQTLLNSLQQAWATGPKSKPFNKKQTWQELLRLARFYSWRVCSDDIPVTERSKQLRDLGGALVKAHCIASAALRSDVGSDLFKAWVSEKSAGIPTIGPRSVESPDIMKCAEEIKAAVAALATLKAAADKAAQTLQRKPGRPPGSILPLDYVIALAALYRKSTHLPPRASSGPFVSVLSLFATAIRASLGDETLVDLVKRARKFARTNFSGQLTSPF